MARAPPRSDTLKPFNSSSEFRLELLPLDLKPCHLIPEDAFGWRTPSSFVSSQGLAQVGLDRVDDRHRLVEPVDVTHQADAARLGGDSTASKAYVDKAPDSVGEVRQARAGRRFVPINQAHRVVASIDGVVRAELVVADDLRASGQRRSRGYIVEAANEPRGTDQAVIGERRPLPRNGSLNEGEDLPTLLIDPQQPRRSLESNVLQKAEQLVDKRGVRPGGAPDGGTDTNNPWCDTSSWERDFVAYGHAGMTLLHSVECVDRDLLPRGQGAQDGGLAVLAAVNGGEGYDKRSENRPPCVTHIGLRGERAQHSASLDCQSHTQSDQDHAGHPVQDLPDSGAGPALSRSIDERAVDVKPDEEHDRKGKEHQG